MTMLKCMHAVLVEYAMLVDYALTLTITLYLTYADNVYLYNKDMKHVNVNVLLLGKEC